MNIPEEYDWSESLDCAVTLCDNEGTVLYQNARSRQVNGDVRGRSLIPCHNERSASSPVCSPRAAKTSIRSKSGAYAN